MPLSNSVLFLMEDSSSSDDYDLEDILFNDDKQLLLMLAAKEEEDNKRFKRPGSKVGRLCIPRNRTLGHAMLMQDYFSKVPTYPAYLFHRRYRMRHSLFVKIVETCVAKTRYFKRRRNAAGLLGFSGYQKISATMRVLAYSILADYDDEYLRISEDTTMESVCRFYKVMIRVFGPTYLRAPNEQDISRLLGENATRGWPGMLGSVDCMH
jgi:hypothetical protein